MLVALFTTVALIVAVQGVVNPHPEWRAPPEGVPPATPRDRVLVTLIFAVAIGVMVVGLFLWKR